jgi:hypothetical protein
MQSCYEDPTLPYQRIVAEPEKYPGYNFTIPAAYIGDPSGCNEKVRERRRPDFD